MKRHSFDFGFRVFCGGSFLFIALGFTRAAIAIEVTKGIEIAQVGNQALHVDMALPSQKSARPMPVVFTIHGGGWKDGTYHDLGRLVGPLTSKGFIVVGVEYRPIPGGKWPAQLEDCLRAVRWMRANAAKYSADPNHFGAWGESAGGHLATCVAIYGDDTRFADKGALAGVSAKLQAVAIGSPPNDILYSETNHLNKPYRWSVETMVGGTPEKNPEAWKEACPVLNVTKNLPPFFIYHGDHDSVVPLAESLHFVDALKKAGVPVEFITVVGGGHDSFSPADKTKPIQPDGLTLIKKAVAFLEKNLKGK
jgi:acetyl esterase/lipase